MSSQEYKTFQRGDRVCKKSGSQWQGKVVGWYSTDLTPEGYAVESESHAGSVQIYPVAALELVESVRPPEGKTTKQMLDAPQGSIFIYADGNGKGFQYAIELARRLGRSDLKIKTVDWLTRDNILELGTIDIMPAIVIDHHARQVISGRQLEVLDYCNDLAIAKAQQQRL